MKIHLLNCLLLLLFPHVSLAADFVKISDSKGREMSARLVSYKPGHVTVLNEANRKQYTLPLESLSEDSQDLVNQWVDSGEHLPARFTVKYTSGKSDRLENAADYDDRVLKLRPKIYISNKSTSSKSRPVELTCAVIGRSVLNKKNLYVFSRESFMIDSLPPLGKSESMMKDVMVTYDDNDMAQFGYKYIGYAIKLESNGIVLYSHFTPSSAGTKYGDQIFESSVKSVLRPN